MAGIQLEPLEAGAEAAESPKLRQRAVRVTMRRCVMLSQKEATRQAWTVIVDDCNTAGSSTRAVHTATRSMFAVTSTMCWVAHHCIICTHSAAKSLCEQHRRLL